LPIQEANVFLSATGSHTKTDESGTFTFLVPFPSLETEVIILADGYPPIKKLVTIKGNTFLSTLVKSDSLPVRLPGFTAKQFSDLSTNKQSPLLPAFLTEPEPEFTNSEVADTTKKRIKVYEQIPFSFSLWPGVSSGRWISTANIPSISVNLVAGSNAGIQGVEFGVLANVLKADMNGLQASGMFNIVRGKVNGVSVGGLASYVGYGVAGVQANGMLSLNRGDLNGMQASGFYSATNGLVRGFQAAGFANRAYALQGVQAAGFTNYVAGYGSGVQLAGFANLLMNHSRSNLLQLSLDSLFDPPKRSHQVSQVAGFFNFSPFNINGIQVSGFANWTSGKLMGLQVGGGFNHAQQVKGLQIGIVNHTKKLKGLQVGLVNIADTAQGFAIGLVNITKGGFSTFDLEYTNNQIATIKFSHFKKAIHWVYTGSISPSDSSVKVWAGMGLGTLIGLTRKRDLLDFSLSAINRFPIADVKTLQTWVSAEAAFYLRLVAGLRLKVGAEINYIAHEKNAPINQLYIPDQKPNNFASTNDSVSWINTKIGLGWRF